MKIVYSEKTGYWYVMKDGQFLPFTFVSDVEAEEYIKESEEDVVNDL